MLLSHRKKFVYIKPEKTASTSIEIFFECFCWPEGDYGESPRRAETVTEAGIVGARGPFPDATWYNHMPAAKIRGLLDANVWEEYFKFSSVRNPFCTLVSGFHMLKRHRDKYEQLSAGRAELPRRMALEDPIFRAEGATEIEQFRSWIGHGGDIFNRDKYMIEGEVCIDFFIRYEYLEADIHEVCGRLAVPFESKRIPQYKTKQRLHDIPIRNYYDLETEQIVRQKHHWEIDRFGYELPGPDVF